MSILDLHAEEVTAAAPRYVPTPAQKPTTSVWRAAADITSAIPRGVAEASAQVGATVAELVAGYGDVMGRIEEGQSLAARGVDLQSDFGDALRDRGREFRPDAQTATAAETILYGFARGATKIVGGAVVGGPGGVLAMGGEEAMSASDDLARQGVDFQTRTAAAAVQGAGLAIAALPLVGQTAAGTAALYVAGGPGGFMAQQAVTREILRAGGYSGLAEEYDPFDPVGLAVSSLIPAGFTAHALRAQRIQRAVKSLPAEIPRETPAAEPQARAEPIPSERTAVAEAIATYPREVEDAARVAYASEVRRDANPVADDITASGRHEAALTRAEDQIAAGEPVSVLDVAPISAAERDANFRAWFGDSKVVDEDGAPLVVYHGTRADVQEFSPAAVGERFGRSIGYYFTSRSDSADVYARGVAGVIDGKAPDGANIVPAYVKADNPLVLTTDALTPEAFHDANFDAHMQSVREGGHDALIIKRQRGDEYDSTMVVALRPEQIKSATGNSGRFDPNSPSLTDPIAKMAGRMRAAADEVAPLVREAEAPRAEPAAKPEPAKQGAPRDLRAEVVGLRRTQAVLQKLLECL